MRRFLRTDKQEVGKHTQLVVAIGNTTTEACFLALFNIFIMLCKVNVAKFMFDFCFLLLSLPIFSLIFRPNLDRQDTNDIIHISYIEIYNDIAYDLLNAASYSIAAYEPTPAS